MNGIEIQRLTALTRMDSDNPLSPHEGTKALNYHGIFFKKRVLEELRRLNGLAIIGEERGVNFGETRVLDVLVADLQLDPHILFPIECKRGWRSRKQWFFFKDCDRVFRPVRSIGSIFSASVFGVGSDDMPVCSEGFELDTSKPPKDERAHKSDQDPVFRAGSQLAAATLGFVANRLREFHRLGSGGGKEHNERIVPVLVTNVEMFVVEGGDWSSVNLVSGCYDGHPEFRAVKHVVLKQPFPTPEGYERDFREFPTSSPDMDSRFRNQLFTESLYVVSASGLPDFFGMENRNKYRTTQTI